MRPIIIYPLPFDAWHTFAPAVQRFSSTFKDFPPGTDDYEVWAVCNLGQPTDQVREMFYGIKTRFIDYPDHGCDIGSAQYSAMTAALEPHYSESLLIAMTSWCYFHRKGWLNRYLTAWDENGPGLYCASTSRESGKLHACTRAYAMDLKLWLQYPHFINTRSKGPRFETGIWCLTDWAQEKGIQVTLVTWDGVRSLEDSRNTSEKGIFRRGDQNAMLVWDRHTDLYRDADEKEKKRLAYMADFGVEPAS